MTEPVICPHMDQRPMGDQESKDLSSGGLQVKWTIQRSGRLSLWRVTYFCGVHEYIWQGITLCYIQVTSSLGFFQFIGFIYSILIIQNNRDKDRREACMKQELELWNVIIENTVLPFCRTYIFKNKAYNG